MKESDLPTYRSWQNMRRRCRDKKRPTYKHYGGRGITVCRRWHNFENFLADMGPRPSLKYSVERKEVNGNYEPGNCFWATQEQQANNKRDNVKITIDGVTKTAAEWQRETGIRSSTIRRRIALGWTPQEAVTKLRGKTGPTAKLHAEKSEAKRVLITFGNETYCAAEWSKLVGIKSNLILERFKYGWPAGKILFTPPRHRGINQHSKNYLPQAVAIHSESGNKIPRSVSE